MLTRPTVSRPRPSNKAKARGPQGQGLIVQAKASNSKAKVKASHFKDKIKAVYLNTMA